MKSKKLLIALLTIALIVMTSLVAVACPGRDDPPPREPGAETGTYYYDAADGEYLLTLSEGDKFTLVMGNVNKSGTFTIEDNGNMAFTFSDGSSASNIRYRNDTVTLTYEGVQMVFRRKVNYTVTFNTLGSGEIPSITVLNGKTIEKPQDPQRNGFVFIGWYKETSYKTPFAFGTEAVTGNLTLYAKWASDDPNVLDFTINLDLNYEGAQELDSMQTIGGRLYGVETPTRAGYVFAGWWVSMFEDANKLSYKYNENVVFTENTTLFALWTTSTSNIYPEVSNTKVTWTGISGITGYSVVITNTEGDVVFNNPNVGASNVSVDWESLPAGEYKVTVSASSHSADRYYNNKALSRVSLFSVTDETVLNFNGVANAEHYYLTIVCGDESHAHDMYDIGNSTSYDFASCPMIEGGIEFIVTATAEGFASSTSRKFAVEKTLGAIELTVDEATEVVSWNEVEFATNYIVSVVCENAAHNHSESANNLIDNGSKTSYCYKECSGNVVINVYPVAKGYNSSVAASTQIAKQTLATPSGIRVIGTVISWNAVAGAQSYELIVDGDAIAVNGTEHDLAEIAGMQPGDEISVQVVAKGSHDSLPSDAVAVLYEELFESISYSNSTVYWKHVAGAESYEIKVNGQVVEGSFVGVNSAEIELTQAGENTISVSYYDADAVKSDEVSVTVMAYAITVHTNNGEEDFEIYRATGDKFNLPNLVRNGYTFVGWYDTVGGGADLGSMLTETTFTLSEDADLYAFWKANVYTVTYIYENDVDDISPVSFDVTFDESYEMPIPTPNDKKFAFVAWTTIYDEMSSRVTDEFGRSIKNWSIYDYDQDGEIKLYPYWIEAFEFDLRDDGGYTVSQNATGIQIINNITIPYTYRDKVVDIIGDFSNCNNLREVKMPSNIETMNVTAFNGCTSLFAIEVYKAPNDYIIGPYTSENGVLIKTDGGVRSLDYVPLGITGTLAVPSTISEISSNAFEGRAITEIVVPTSVTLIKSGAFRGSYSLTNVVFEEGGANSLVIQKEAFADCTALVEVSLPTRFTLVTSGVNAIAFPDLFVGCSSLQRVTIADDHAQFVSDDGVVLTKDRMTLAYYPMARVVGELAQSIRYIGSSAFYGNVSLTDVTLSNNIIGIDNYAFAQCPNLTSISTGNGVSYIGNYAFYGDKSLRSITIGNSVRSIGNYAFVGCSRLDHVYLDVESNRLTTIGENAFYECTNLVEITLPNSVSNIGKYAFYGCSLLSNVITAGSYLTAPDESTGIGEYAFAECRVLSEITIPGSVAKIGKYSFNNCFKLTTVIVSNSVKVIAPYAFYCDRDGAKQSLLSSIELGSGIREIQEGAFANCGNLVSITLPDSLEKIISSGDRMLDANGQEMQEPVLDENGKPVLEPVLDDKGNPIYEPVLDDEGNPTYEPVLDDEGNPTYEPVLDEEGNPTYDEEGNPITKPVTKPVVKPVTKPAMRPVTYKVDAFDGCSSLIMVYNFSKLNVEKGRNTYGSVARYAKHLLTDENETSVKLVTTDDGFVFYVEDGVTSLVNYVGGETTVVLPDNFEDESYIIADGAFQSRTYITNVVISGGVTSIGANAFSNCTGLVSVTVGENVASIGNNAFSNCPYLYEVFDLTDHLNISKGSSANGGIAAHADYINTDANIASRVAGVDGYIFDTNSSGEYYLRLYTGTDTDLVLPDEVNGKDYNVVKSSFSGLTITSIVFGRGVKAIPDSLFENNRTITSVTVIGNGLTTIGKNAFASNDGAPSLTSVHIGSGVKSIGDRAFYVNPYNSACRITELIIEEGVESIGSSAFYHPLYLTSLTLPASLKKIGSSAFYGAYNSNLAEVTILGDGTTEIGNDAFYQHPNLVSLTLGEGIKKIGSNAFAKCSSITKVVIPNSVTDIGASAFSECEKLSDLTVGSGVTTAGSGAFKSCPIEVLVLVEGIKAIPDNMFSGCTTLIEVTIPEGVESIGNSAFAQCSSLLQVNISSTVKTIGTTAFRYCSSMVSIILGESVEKINSMAFTGCNNLVEVYDLSDKITIEKGSTANGNVAKNAQIIRTSRQEPSIFEIVDGFMFTDFSELGGEVTLKGYRGTEKLLIFPDFRGKRYSIADGAFQNNTSITGVIIPGTVDKIGDYAFQISDDFSASHPFEGSAIRTVIMANGVREIGKYAFNKCSRLAGVKVPGSVKTIGEGAFRLCGSMAYVDIRDGVETIGKDAFYECTGISYVQIPDSVKTIGNQAFNNCRGLECIVLGKGVTSVGSNAFGGCSLLETIYYNGTSGSVSGIPGRVVYLPNWEFVDGRPVEI